MRRKTVKQYKTIRDVARNLLRSGTKEEVWETEVPQRGPEAEPRWGLPEARDKCQFPATTGRTCTHVPLGYATVNNLLSMH